jgi:hypothetical protein
MRIIEPKVYKQWKSSLLTTALKRERIATKIS